MADRAAFPFELLQVKILDKEIAAKMPEPEGLDFNPFIFANTFMPERRTILFTFKTEMEDIWKWEAMYYILSELQLYFYEYRCAGELV
jgi:hypothetical protein